MKRVTIKDIALDAKVSIATVSHVINETRYVEPETKERVLSSLDRLGYHPNSIAKSLRSGFTKTIGLILPDVSNLYFAEIAKRIEKYGFENGYSVILGNSSNSEQREKQYLETLISKSVDGIIFISSGAEAANYYDTALMRNVPVVVADRNLPKEFADLVLVDNELGGYIAAKHLIETGCKNIACIGGPNLVSPSMDRVRGFQRALQERGADISKIVIRHGDFSIKGGWEAMALILEEDRTIDGVFVLNDMMAIGAINKIRTLGIAIPENISVIGFDNIELSAYLSPPLTTIAQPVDEIARITVSFLIERIQEGNRGAKKRVLLPPTLIVRNSTKRR